MKNIKNTLEMFEKVSFIIGWLIANTILTVLKLSIITIGIILKISKITLQLLYKGLKTPLQQGHCIVRAMTRAITRAMTRAIHKGNIKGHNNSNNSNTIVVDNVIIHDTIYITIE